MENPASKPQLEPLKPDVIRHLGRTICIGACMPWLMSSFTRIHPGFFFGVILALLLPRFVFRRRRAPLVVEWRTRDGIWGAAALLIMIAYVLALTPPRLAGLIGW